MSNDDYRVQYAGTPVTGSFHLENEVHEVKCSFDRYLIKVQVNSNDKFIGISEITVNKEFLSQDQQMLNANPHNLDKYYYEDE